QLIPFNPGKLFHDNDDSQNILLEPQDSVYIFSKWLFRDKPAVTIEGEVRNKGTFALPENYRIKDAILEAGGLTKDASPGKGEIFRKSGTGDISQIYFSVGYAMSGDPAENLLLKDEDTIRVHSIWEERQKQVVSIDGDVKSPGQYTLANDMRVSDLIFSAGNILESAYLDEAEISSLIIDTGKSVNTDYRKINLRRALDNDPAHNIVLRPYDRVFVKRIPEWKEDRFVEINGEIKFPGRYIIKRGETLSSVLERAGGYTDKAYLRGAVFTRKEVRKLQQENLKALVLRLERELLIEGSVQISTSLSKEEIEAKKVELEQKRKFLESLSRIEATGRMSISLTHIRLLKNGPYDIELEDGDRLNIPMKNNVVNVAGAVMSPGSFIFADNLDYKNYINMSGGYSKYADTGSVYVLKTDGTAKKLPNGFFEWSNSRDRWEMTAFGEDIKDIEPGDSIVVPEKLDRIAWIREIKDITQILYQIAVTAGVLVVVF
ncbi:MAG: SLBB domain-containing protein, partial [Nitrospirae bacterium]|nr:SLBB domain-containing protein [Nitrospirota bacterium]